MAALEYLTHNSLTAYPFKTGRVVGTSDSNQIEDDWFYDILFTSYSREIREVYLSKASKKSSGALELAFSNGETLAQIGDSFTLPAGEVVNHYLNQAKSFAHYICTDFSVKLVLGPGLLAKGEFTRTYTKAEGSLVSGAIVLASPQVKTINIETYASTPVGNKIQNSLEHVATFTSTSDELVIEPRYNSVFEGISEHQGDLYVEPGIGAGLYDGCEQPEHISKLYSINSVTPDSKGALWLNPSACYSLNTLSAKAAIDFGNYDLDGALYQYHSFTTNREDLPTFDAVSIGHSLYLQNFCKPKCPPENLAAFAYYLNRVVDGAKELNTIATSNTETRGKGTSNLKVFTASAFCVEGDTSFERCTDSSNTEAYIACNNRFVKYFHEGRTLQISYADPTLRKNFTIVEVLENTNSVLLDAVPTPPSGSEELSFRVLDNGVISNMNCAASLYNLDAASFLQPYFKVKYTTTEAFNPDGKYVTYVTVTVALFNPAPASKQLLVNFEPNDKFHQQGNYKIRTDDGVEISQDGAVQLNCRKYAFVEAAYYIECETSGGQLAIHVYSVDSQNLTQIGQTFNLPTIDGTACPGTTAGSAYSARVLQSTASSFQQTLTLPSAMSEVLYYPSKTGPFWLNFEFTAHQDKVYLSHDILQTLPSTSTRYYTTFKTYGGDIPGVISRLIIDYVANPIITSPLENNYNLLSPLNIGRDVEYTADNPVFQITAKNMTILSSDYPEDLTNFRYSLEAVGYGGLLPDGLVFDSSTGKLTGKLADSYQDGDTFEFKVNAYNTSGPAANMQLISVIVATGKIPQVTIVSPPADNVFNISNLEVFSDDSPLLSLAATNAPISQYVLIGTLPAGLTFDSVQGKIVGVIKEDTSGSKDLSVFTRNVFGPSNTVYFNLTFTVYAKPVITSPDNLTEVGFRYDQETTEISPAITISSLQALGGSDNYATGLTDTTRNKYLAIGLPLGYVIGEYTGKIYGLLDASLTSPFSTGQAQAKTYAVRVIVSNPVGSTYVNLLLSLYVPGKPFITSISGSTISLIRGNTYTSTAPVNSIFATNSPTGYTATGLPSGLSCTSGGKVVGVVSNVLAAGLYTSTISAYNAEGYSSDVSYTYLVPVGLLSPQNNSTISVEAGQLVSIPLVYTDLLIQENLNISVTGLPAGVTYGDDLIAGTPTVVGSYQIKITITSVSLGSSITTINLVVAAVSYSISGTLTLNTPTEGYSVEGTTINLGAISTTVDAEGKFTFNGLQPAVYTVQPVAANNHLIFTPALRTILLNDADFSGANFAIEGPFRQISGTLTSIGGAAVTSISVASGNVSTTTDNVGKYSLLLPMTSSITITPSSVHHTFNPASRTYSDLTTFDDITNVDFSAVSSIIPTAPQVKTFVGGDQQIAISFAAPVNAATSAITNYEYALDSGSYVELSPANPSATSLIIPGLTNGTAYTVSFRAVSGSIKGFTASFTATPTAGTVVVVLDPPVAPVIAENGITGGDRSLSVAFTTTDSDAAQIVNHQYTIDDGNTWLTLNPTVIDSPLTLLYSDQQATRLVNGQTYSVKIRAVNINGVSGEPSTPARQGTPIAVPSAPIPTTTNTFQLGDGTATYNFVPPLSDGGSPILYYQYSLNSAEYVTILPASSSTSSVTLTGLTNGVSYNLRIRAANAFGVGTPTNPTAFTPRRAPDAPTIASGGVVAGDKKLTVFFTPPVFNGGAPILGYEYLLSGNSGRVRAGVVNNSFEITKTDNGSQLINGTTYSITLAAINAAGAGALSSPARSATPTAGANPPTIVSLTPGDKKLTALILPPTNTGGEAISGYVYKVGLASDAWRSVVPITQSEAGITFDITTTGTGGLLANGTSYLIYIASVNSLGPGTPATRSGKPIGPADAPTIITIRPTTKQLSVEFTPPTFNGGSVITGYKYQLTAGGGWTDRVPLNSLTSPIIITGLTDGTDYTVSIRAVTAYGDGLVATYPVTVKPGLLPAAPVITSVSSGDKQLTVYVDSPTDNGSPAVTDYQYNVGNGWLSRDNSPSADRPVVITKKQAGIQLVNGETYNIKLRAVNFTGAGPESNPLTGTSGTPGTPAISSVASSQNSLAIYFEPVAGISGAPVQGYQYSVTTSTTDTWITPSNLLTSPITVSSLTNATTYRVKLRAYNANGYGGASAAIIAVPGYPSAPVISDIQSTSPVNAKSALTIYSTLASDGGSPVINYEISADGGATFKALSPAVSSSPITLTGVTSGTIYRYAIKAVTALGKSPASNVFAALPGGTTAPKITSVSIVENTHLIAFTSPVYLSKTIQRYEAGLLVYDTLAEERAYTIVPLSAGTSSPLSLTGYTAAQYYTTLAIRAIFTDLSTSPWSVEPVELPSTASMYPIVLQSYAQSALGIISDVACPGEFLGGFRFEHILFCVDFKLPSALSSYSVVSCSAILHGEFVQLTSGLEKASYTSASVQAYPRKQADDLYTLFVGYDELSASAGDIPTGLAASGTPTLSLAYPVTNISAYDFNGKYTMEFTVTLQTDTGTIISQVSPPSSIVAEEKTPATPPYFLDVSPEDEALKITYTPHTAYTNDETGACRLNFSGVEYSLNNGATYITGESFPLTEVAGLDSVPRSFYVYGLNNGTPYNVKLRQIGTKGDYVGKPGLPYALTKLVAPAYISGRPLKPTAVKSLKISLPISQTQNIYGRYDLVLLAYDPVQNGGNEITTTEISLDSRKTWIVGNTIEDADIGVEHAYFLTSTLASFNSSISLRCNNSTGSGGATDVLTPSSITSNTTNTPGIIDTWTICQSSAASSLYGLTVGATGVLAINSGVILDSYGATMKLMVYPTSMSITDVQYSIRTASDISNTPNTWNSCATWDIITTNLPSDPQGGGGYQAALLAVTVNNLTVGENYLLQFRLVGTASGVYVYGFPSKALAIQV
jgi:hypothetical protein